jgi:hypothetical protein
MLPITLGKIVLYSFWRMIMKRRIVVVALLCGALGSSYANGYNSQSYNQGNYQLGSSSSGGYNLNQFRNYSQGAQRSSYSQSGYQGAQTSASQPTQTDENYVINEQTGEKVTLNNSQASAYQSNSYGQGYQRTQSYNQETAYNQAGTGYANQQSYQQQTENYAPQQSYNRRSSGNRWSDSQAEQPQSQSYGSQQSYQQQAQSYQNARPAQQRGYEEYKFEEPAAKNNYGSYQQTAQTQNYQQQYENSSYTQNNPSGYQQQETAQYQQSESQYMDDSTSGNYIRRGRENYSQDSQTMAQSWSDEPLNTPQEYSSQRNPQVRTNIAQQKPRKRSRRGGFSIGNPFRGISKAFKNMFSFGRR